MKKVTLLDGGMGQELLSRSSRPVTPLWSADIMLNEPNLVRDLHRDFIESGARVITLNTYTATAQRLAHENQLDKMQELHQSAMQAASQAIEMTECSEVAIAACLPPLVASYRPEVNLPYKEAFHSYQQLVALQNPASDLFLCETMASMTEATAACSAAIESGKPVWVALTVSDTTPGVLRSGESVAEVAKAVVALGADAVLLNCSQPESISTSWHQLSQIKQKLGAYANGFVSVTELHPGGTVEALEARSDLDPKQYAEHAIQWARQGASIIGGCCEIGPKHIKALHLKLLEEGFA